MEYNYLFAKYLKSSPFPQTCHSDEGGNSTVNATLLHFVLRRNDKKG